MTDSAAQRLWLMRHGEAGPGQPDEQRSLTAQGEREAAQMATWLAEHYVAQSWAPPRLLASPFRRAQQTAAHLSKALAVPVETLPLITPDDAPDAVIEWLIEQTDERLILVSHMPLVGVLAETLVEGRSSRGVGFPTAGLAELTAPVWASGCAQLKRFVHPSQLG
ncbi:phosphohistidine phosphatase SixA [Vreelandella arcis]|uniref:Phosphohistidine phosphatase, SixA n=1 Tax=Vreelandella arcis TaxID=416873 RepID=A0A1G9ZG35_9GAMM|nr:phosphohistidine phosphatase SixA [Halomonas arcis]SDN20288.1 phosphohistidine phosphatase, SixA [Halomonas arcis]